MKITKVESYQFKVCSELHDSRLDKYLASNIPALSRSKLQEIIQQGGVNINTQPIQDKKHKVAEGDTIDIIVNYYGAEEKPSLENKKKADVTLSIVYEDEDMLVIDKPAGLLVHPGAGRSNQLTLIDYLFDYCGDSLSNVAGPARPGIVHRLDLETSGLMMVAKTNKMHELLAAELAEHTIERKYIAFVHGLPVPNVGRIETYIRKNPQKPTQMMVSPSHEGKRAISRYRTTEVYMDGRFAAVEVKLETGRTHQIRVHMAYRKNPVIGDKVYGRNLNFGRPIKDKALHDYIRSFARHALHSKTLSFTHPMTQELIELEAPIPQDLANLHNMLASAGELEY